LKFTKVSTIFEEYGVEEVGLYKSNGTDAKDKPTVRFAGSDKNNKIMLITKKTDNDFGTAKDWLKIVKEDAMYCYKAPERDQPVDRNEPILFYVTNKSEMREADILVSFK